jgi:hypothetical protein
MPTPTKPQAETERSYSNQSRKNLPTDHNYDETANRVGHRVPGSQDIDKKNNNLSEW